MSAAPTRIRRGQIWTVVLPSFPKPRPALVVSIDPINDLCPDVLMVPITTKPGPLRVPLGQALEQTGLRRQSYAKCESVGPVHKARLKKAIGSISKELTGAVEEGLRLVLGL